MWSMGGFLRVTVNSAIYIVMRVRFTECVCQVVHNKPLCSAITKILCYNLFMSCSRVSPLLDVPRRCHDPHLLVRALEVSISYS
jgi:hypothetical protein